MITAWFIIVFLTTVSAQEPSTRELLERIERFENLGKRQAEEIAYQREELVNQRQEISNDRQRFEREAAQQKERVSTLERLIQKQGKQIQLLEETIAEYDVYFDSEKNGEIDRYGKIQSPENIPVGHGANNTVYRRSASRRQAAQEGSIAFQAYIGISEQIHLNVGQKIIYDTTNLNVGNGFNKQLGVFTAPEVGMYIFSTSIMAHYKPHSEIWVGIMKNGVDIASAYAYGDANRDQGAVTVVAQLTAGDQVWVELLGLTDDSLWGHRFTNFMGCLVERY